jgi:hypothetical protein
VASNLKMMAPCRPYHNVKQLLVKPNEQRKTTKP